MPDRSWLTDDVVAAVTAHMNGDHATDNVVICKGAGGWAEVERAEMTGIDVDAIEFTATSSGGESRVLRIGFAEPLRDRGQIRAEVARMFHESGGSAPGHPQEVMEAAAERPANPGGIRGA